MTAPATGSDSDVTRITFLSAIFSLTIDQDPFVITGAFAGSLIFVVSASDFSLPARIALFASSMLIGITASDFTATLTSSLLSSLLNISVSTPVAVGATLSSVTAVRLLMFLCEKPQKTGSVFDRLRKRRDE